MDSSGIFYEELVVWCYFDVPSLDSSPCPSILREMQNAHNHAKKVTAFIWRVVVTEWLNIKKPENKLAHKAWSTYILILNVQVALDPVS